MVDVRRTLGLDAARHLALRGRYPRQAALPDRYASWWLTAVPVGLTLIRRHRPRVIWSTYPVATAHLIGLTLHRLSRLPWVADFRDSMTEEGYPRDPLRRRAHAWIEERAVARAARLVFTAPSTIAMYRARYPWLDGERCAWIPNGYDETDFDSLAPSPAAASPGRPLRLVHSGVVYPEERDPRPFFQALSRLKQRGLLNAWSLEVLLRGSGFQADYSRLLRELGVDDIVHLVPPVGYREALQECVEADALLLLQGASCDHQIPAKAYEYLRARRPILALTAERGDTAALLRDSGGATIIDLADADAIAAALPGFLREVRDGTHPLPDMTRVSCHAREERARDLAVLLDEVAARASAESGAGGGRHLRSMDGGLATGCGDAYVRESR